MIRASWRIIVCVVRMNIFSREYHPGGDALFNGDNCVSLAVNYGHRVSEYCSPVLLLGAAHLFVLLRICAPPSGFLLHLSHSSNRKCASFQIIALYDQKRQSLWKKTSMLNKE